MLGLRCTEQYEFFVGSLRDLVPDDHVLARVDRVLDLSWLREEVEGLYCPDDGRPGIDPETAVRLMLAGFLLGLVHDRRLLREAAVNVAMRWFARFGLTERLPHHSTMTRIRQRWGDERFRRIFERTVRACIAAGVAKGEVVHVDASLIRADVSWEALAVRWVDRVGQENPPVDPEERDAKQSGKYKKVCTTDPDATMATAARRQRLEPSYKQHTAAGYAYAKVYGELERRGTGAVIPPKAEPIRSKVPMRRFRYDARHDILKCPRGKVLKPGRAVKHGRFFTSRAKDCGRCDLRALCLSGGCPMSRITRSHCRFNGLRRANPLGFRRIPGVTGGTLKVRRRLMEMQAADYLERPHLA